MKYNRTSGKKLEIKYASIRACQEASVKKYSEGGKPILPTNYQYFTAIRNARGLNIY
jgi:hypothetical protein